MKLMIALVSLNSRMRHKIRHANTITIRSVLPSALLLEASCPEIPSGYPPVSYSVAKLLSCTVRTNSDPTPTVELASGCSSVPGFPLIGKVHLLSKSISISKGFSFYSP